MHVAIPLYPRFTALDAVGPYNVLSLAPGITVTFVADAPGPVTDDQGTLAIVATAGYADVPAPDVILVPGGPGTLEALNDEALLGWIRAVHPGTTFTTSVCSGSFLLGAAGVLDGLPATTHWAIIDGLASFGATPVRERVVEAGKVVTAAGVASGIDMALTLLARLTDRATAETVQLAIEYDPQPPFDAGSAEGAPRDRIERATALIV